MRQLGARLVPAEGAVLVLLLAQHDATGRRGVAQRAAADLERVVGGDEVVDGVDRPRLAVAVLDVGWRRADPVVGRLLVAGAVHPSLTPSPAR